MIDGHRVDDATWSEPGRALRRAAAARAAVRRRHLPVPRAGAQQRGLRARPADRRPATHRAPRSGGLTMAPWPKPPEGQLDRALPRARHRPRLVRRLACHPSSTSSSATRSSSGRGSTSGASRTFREAGQLLHQGDRRSRTTSIIVVRGTRRRGPGVPQRLPPPRQQAGVDTTSRARRPAAPAGSSPASTTAGATTSTAHCTFVQQEDEFFDLDKADNGLVAGPLRRVERVHLHQPRPRAAPDAARVPRPDDHRARRLPVRPADRALRLRRRQQQQLEALRRRVPGVLPRALAAPAAGAGGRAQPGRRRSSARTSSSTARTAS